MKTPKIITSNQELNDINLESILNSAITLSQESEFDIENFADKVYDKPETIAFLENTKVAHFIESEQVGGSLTLKGVQHKAFVTSVHWDLGIRFKKLKRKIKKLFCQIVDLLRASDSIDWKEVIKKVLAAIITALGLSLSPAVTIIVVSLVALVLKKGIAFVCPV